MGATGRGWKRHSVGRRHTRDRRDDVTLAQHDRAGHRPVRELDLSVGAERWPGPRLNCMHGGGGAGGASLLGCEDRSLVRTGAGAIPVEVGNMTGSGPSHRQANATRRIDPHADAARRGKRCRSTGPSGSNCQCAGIAGRVGDLEVGGSSRGTVGHQ